MVAVLGAGKIGQAVSRILSKRAEVSEVILTKRNLATLGNRLPKKYVLESDNVKAAKKADVVIMAVKAADAKKLADQISESVDGKLVISLMAAISISRLERHMPGAKVVRAMTNIAATIGEAVTAFACGSKTKEMDKELAVKVLGSLGDAVEVPESAMDAVTALSGSGPAYIAILIDAMVSAGLKVGLSRDVALRLSIGTLNGTANLITAKRMRPDELRDLVTTPAGTTIAGIYELEKGSFRTSIMNAVEAATAAAGRVAKKFETEGE